MRVTNAMMTRSVIWNISDNLNRMNTVYTQMSSGERIEQPSQDPVAASKSLEYQAYITELNQYSENVEDADGWMSVTESSVESMIEIVTRVNELTLQANNDTLTSEDRMKIDEEIGQLQDELLKLGNTDYGGDYIFAGYDTDSPPFTLIDKLGGSVTAYKGSALNLQGPFDSSLTDADILSWYNVQTSGPFTNEEIHYPTSKLQTTNVNLNGHEVFGSGEDSLMANLDFLRMYLGGQSSYKYVDETVTPPVVVVKEIDVDQIIEDLNKSADTLIEKQTEVGSRVNSNTLKGERILSDIEMYSNLLSGAKDADMAELSVAIAEAEMVYEASLIASSKIIMPTLLNFI